MADEYERMEEDDQMRLAIAESQKQEEQQKKLDAEEDEMIRQAIEMSKLEEEAR